MGINSPLTGKRPGFLLYEAVVTLIVTVMTLGILQQCLLLTQQIHRDFENDSFRLQVTLLHLQETLAAAENVAVENGRITYQVNNEHYLIENYHDRLLRLRKAEAGGHLPLITQLKQCQIFARGNLIVIAIRDQKNKLSELYLVKPKKPPLRPSHAQ